MKTALLLIATGERYHRFIRPLLASAAEFFVPHTALLWTDSTELYNAATFALAPEGFPKATLHRYHTFYKYASALVGFDQLFYCDIDMRWVSPVKGEEIWSEGITATLHPGFVLPRVDPATYEPVFRHGTPERRRASTAFIPNGAENDYYCGGFNGGGTKAFLEMADALRKNIDADANDDITAVWHDESHLNRYLWDNKPSKVLTPSFCYPEDYHGEYGWDRRKYEPKLIALNKRKYL